MKAVVFVPGTMGTSLHNAGGDELWPPRPLETKLGYKRMDALMGNDVSYGKIIEKVLCLDLYGSIFQWLNDLKFSENDPERRLIAFPYRVCWRKMLRTR
jgi:phospholipase A1